MNKELAHKALETALRCGASDARIALGEGTDTSISFLNGEIERLQESSAAALAFHLFVDGRFGVFTTNRLKEAELEPFIRRCIESVRLLAEDDCRVLPDPSLYYKGTGADLKQHDSRFFDIPFAEKTAILAATHQETGIDDPRQISAACDYDDSLKSEYIIDSQGLEVEDHRTFYTISCECTLKDQGDIRPQNYWYHGSMFFDQLAPGAGRKAYERTAAMLDACKIASGRYNIVIENAVAQKMVSPIISALQGGSIHYKSSFLLDSLGKELFPKSLCIAENPLTIGAYGSAYYDSEGVATRYTDIVKDGRIETYILNTYYARKLQMPRTIESVSSIMFPTHHEMGAEEIMAQVGTGIYVTGFNGGNSNPVTGDFSYGIEGFWFENGKRVHSIKEMNMTGNFLSLWRKNCFIGNDPLEYVQWQIPTLAFEDVDISGI